MHENDVSGLIVDAAIDVHRHLGPGLLESVYQKCLAYELLQRGLEVECEKPVPIRYKDALLDCDLRIDLLVNRIVIVKTKTVEALAPIHTAQVLTYLKITGLHIGLLLKFNVPMMKQGIKRIAH